MSALFRTIIRSIGTENITSQAVQFFNAMIEQKKSIPLQEGESDIAALLYEKDGIIYYITAAFDSENKVKRFIGEPLEIKDLINNALKNL